jgi:hypothetical protein
LVAALLMQAMVNYRRQQGLGKSKVFATLGCQR